MASHPDFDAFVATIAQLRAPDGCPWDRAQTHQSIAHNMIEEAYEAVDAIEAEDVKHLREELGDVLLQVVLQAQIAADAGEFTIDDVCRDINDKMVRRHPHIFGDLLVREQVAHFPMDRHEILRPYQRMHQLQLLRAGMAGRMHIGRCRIRDHLDPALDQRIDDAIHKQLIARDRTRRQHHRIAAAQPDTVMRSERHPVPSGRQFRHT